MTKLQKFRQALKTQILSDKHKFKHNCGFANGGFGPKAEACDGWIIEGFEKNMRRKMRKGNGPMLVAC